MCRAKSEGGRRCPDSTRLEKLTAARLAPARRAGVPEVDWSRDDLSGVWAQHDRGVACAAIATIESAAARDERTCSDMTEAASAAGGSMYGLAYRLKSPGSLARKLSTKVAVADARGDSAEPEAVAESITDVTRYTALSAEHDGIVPTARATVGQLQARGWRVIEAEQSYVSGNPYKGLHLLVQHEDGQVAELQIQSARSQEIKDRSHVLYEISRDMGRPMDERRDADREGRELYAGLEPPAGLDELAELGGCPVRKKQYT